MFPTLIELGGLRLATYGVFVAAGYLLGISWLSANRGRMGLSEARFWNLVYVLFAGAVLGGKLLYWAVEWRDIASGALRPLRDFRYGFVFYGGFLGAAAAGWVFHRRTGVPYLATADWFGVALPWGIRFTRPEALVEPGLLGVPLHPVQLYESAAQAAIAWAAWRVLRRVRAGSLPKGSAFLASAALYAAARFAIESLRGDDRGGFLLSLSVSQWIALGCLAASGAAFAALRGRGRP